MTKIGRRIYFEIITGNIIVDKGEMQDSVIATTIDQDITTFTALSERNRETFDVIELPFGAYTQDFAECNGYKVNPTTKVLEFTYPDPNTPIAPQVFIKPLTEQNKELSDQLVQLSSDFQGLTDLLAGNGVI